MAARLIVPATAKRGEHIEIKLSILHAMETGLRRKDDGKLVPKNVIETLTITYGNLTLFEAQLGTGVSANPYFAFSFLPAASDTVTARWIDSLGAAESVSAKVTLNA
jgi:sulfur-oxidizing protein SoxZ